MANRLVVFANTVLDCGSIQEILPTWPPENSLEPGKVTVKFHNGSWREWTYHRSTAEGAASVSDRMAADAQALVNACNAWHEHSLNLPKPLRRIPKYKRGK